MTKLKKIIFERMKEIGWNLDDFEGTLDVHEKTINEILEEHEEKGIENELTWACQFLGDLISVL